MTVHKTRNHIGHFVLTFGTVLSCLTLPGRSLAQSGVQDQAYSEMKPRYFDVRSSDTPEEQVHRIRPWKSVELPKQDRGSWVVTGDLTGNGQRDIVVALTHGGGSQRYTSAAAAYTVEGDLLWRWGDPDISSGRTGFDVACQIYDWDGNGHNDVLVATNNALVEIDGRTGQEKRRIPIPPGTSDCITFCNLQGGKRAQDVLLKSRYDRILALDKEGKQLWSVTNPGGYGTAHQARPMDINQDGRDEVLAGYAMLDADGSIRWVLDESHPYGRGTDLGHGHLDCGRLLTRSKDPAESHMILTFCGGNRIARADGRGRFIWRVAGVHFESADIGNVIPDAPSPQIVVDIDHRPWGEGPLCFFSVEGELLGRIMTDRARHHLLIEWNGDDYQEVVVSQEAALFNGKGEKTAIFETPAPEGSPAVKRQSLICASSDMTGDAIPDLLFWTNPGSVIWIYENTESKTRVKSRVSHSDNYTFY